MTDRLTEEESQFVEMNAGLVHLYLRQRRVAQDDWDDAWQDGMLGVMRAVKKFEPERGWRFSTYAFCWIRQYVQRGFDTRAGINFRYAKQRGLDYQDPISLDGKWRDAADNIDPYDWAGSYVADPLENVEARVEARLELTAFLDEMVELKAGLTETEWITLVADPAEAAARLGISRDLASAQRTRLRRKLRAAVA